MGSQQNPIADVDKMLETIFWWIFTLACVLAFFFAYGMVENLIRQ
jgi:hypothetical protein